jgi:cytochrome c-type biogenesis protein
MQDTVGRLRSLTPGRLILIGLIIALGVAIVLGTINQASVPEPEFSFGLQTQPFLVLTVLAFAGGLLSFLSPCTLPILPAYFAFAFQSGRRQIALNTFAFLLGLAAMFSLLGAGASAIGSVLRSSQNLILLLGGSLVLVFGVMSLLGKGFTGFKQEEEQVQRSTTLGGSFIFGLTFAVGWSSCVGPILGTVLTMAATTGSVMRGSLLLFIYALGLGLPLLVVSTLFGRASRQSLFWRVLRGKGRDVTVHAVVVGLLWALAIWRILVAVADYLLVGSGQVVLAWQEYGLLAVAILGVALWIFTSPGERRVTLQLHSTQLISGLLFILLGVLMLNGTLATFNTLVPPDLAIWFADVEDQLISLFTR